MDPQPPWCSTVSSQALRVDLLSVTFADEQCIFSEQTLHPQVLFGLYWRERTEGVMNACTILWYVGSAAVSVSNGFFR